MLGNFIFLVVACLLGWPNTTKIHAAGFGCLILTYLCVLIILVDSMRNIQSTIKDYQKQNLLKVQERKVLLHIFTVFFLAFFTVC